LQHGRALSLAQSRQQDDLAVGEFKRIVMYAGLVHIDLPESGQPLPEFAARKDAERGFAFDVLLEGVSVPASRQTATLASSSAAKPPVGVLKNLLVRSLSPTLAGRLAT